MIKKTFDIALKIGREDIVIAPAIVVQNDYEVYSLNIRIFDGYEEIDYSQVSSATITFALANNMVVQSDPERLTLSSVGITYEMGTDEINYPGDVIGSVQLLGSSGERITTARFKFPVLRDLITPGAVQSDSNFPLLQKLLADVEQLKSDIVNLQVSNGSLLDEKLSDAAGQIKARVASHLADDAAHKMSHKNLLHNWDFRNSVNQRGQTTYSSAGYTIDRWRDTVAHTVTIQSDCIAITFAGWSLWHQIIENAAMLAGKTITLSMNVKSVNGNVAMTISANGTTQETFSITQPGIVTKTFTLPSNVSALTVGIYGAVGAYVQLYSAKLELGLKSTLADDPPADYGEQLALCQRYAFKIPVGGGYFRVGTYNANSVFFSIPVTTTLRIVPSIESGSFSVVSVAGVAQTGFTFSIYNNLNNIVIAATKTAHGLTDAALISNGIMLSSDL